MKYKDTNELVHAVALRAKQLANETLPALRYALGTADTFHGAQRENSHLSRGDCVEQILEEEFTEEFPVSLEEEK